MSAKVALPFHRGHFMLPPTGSPAAEETARGSWHVREAREKSWIHTYQVETDRSSRKAHSGHCLSIAVPVAKEGVRRMQLCRCLLSASQSPMVQMGN